MTPRRFELEKRFDIAEVNDATHTVSGIAASETPDGDDEIWDYTYGKQAMEKWSNNCLASTTAANMEPSRGNVRIMHGLELGGKITQLSFDDAKKTAWIETQPVDD